MKLIKPLYIDAKNLIQYKENMSELTVIIKDEGRTYRQKFLMYEPYTISEHDETLKRCVEEALKNFGESSDCSVYIRVNFQL